tara:strand:+ start:105 stop:473 length:369 start_codon:yes stop_codon:yes gene_type:complete
MALADRKSDTIHSKTGTDKDALKAEYDAGKHEALVSYPAEAALLYQIQLMKEDIDELRRYITAEVGDGATGAAGRDGAAGANGRDGADGTTPTMTSLSGSSLPTRAPARGLLWNDRGIVKIG